MPKNVEVSEEVSSLLLEALSADPVGPTQADYEQRVEILDALRRDFDLDNAERAAPYTLCEASKDACIAALSNIQIPVTHPNWVALTQAFVKARVELGIS